MSISVMSISYLHRITPREEFSVLWIENCTALSTNLTVFSKISAWVLFRHSTRKQPSRSLLVLFRVPAIAWKPFCTAKGESLLRKRFSSLPFMIKTRDQLLRLMKFSLSESVSVSFRLLLLGVLCVCVNHISFIGSLHLVPTHHRVSRGVYTASGQSTRVHQGSKCNILRLQHKYTLIDPLPLPSNTRLGQSTASRLIEVSHNNHPSRGSPGQRDVLVSDRPLPIRDLNL